MIRIAVKYLFQYTSLLLILSAVAAWTWGTHSAYAMLAFLAGCWVGGLWCAVVVDRGFNSMFADPETAARLIKTQQRHAGGTRQQLFEIARRLML